MFPYKLDLVSMKYRWSHLRCIPIDSPRALCKHMVKLGRCSLGSSCFFDHPNSSLGNSPQLANLTESRVSSKHKLIKSGRAFAFRRFLCAQYPSLFLTISSSRSAPLVIDVAGGKGELSFELTNLNGANCIVMDPRPVLDLSSFIDKWNRGLYVRNKHWKPFSPYFQEHSQPQAPTHWRLLVDKQLLNWIAEEAPSCRPEEYHAFVTKSINTLYFSDAAMPDKPSDEGVIPGFPELIETIKKADILLGLHPDAAAEFIVDIGLTLNIPFAVVPCCVFPESFPHRRLPDGRQVRNCDEFVEYLLLKDPRIKEETLEFQGRNRCVYFKPETFDQREEEKTAKTENRQVKSWIASYL